MMGGVSGVDGRRLMAVPVGESRRWRFAVFLGYVVVGVFFTWPLALDWRGALVQKLSGPTDAGQSTWNLWWTAQSVLRFHNPYLTSYVFYPQPINLFWQTLSLPNALLAFPATVVFGPIAGFNLLALLSFGLGGYFAYRLALSVVGARDAALVAGFVFAFSGYHMQMLLGGPMELIAVQWVPLYVGVLMRALDRVSVRSTLAAGGALALTTLASQYYGLFCAVYTAVHVVLVLGMGPFRERVWRLFVAGGVGCAWVVALLPFVWPLQSLGATALDDWRDRQVYHSLEVVDFFAPNVLHPWWGERATGWLRSVHGFGVETGAALGFMVLALVVYGCVRRRAAWVWLVLAMAMASLTLGPELQVGNRLTGIPMPFALLDFVGPFRNSSRPTAFLAILMLLIGVLVGFGFQALRERYGRVVAGVVLVVLVVEYLVGAWPIRPQHVSPYYADLHADPVAGAVLELPPNNDGSQYMLNQLCHGRPLAGGYLARTPDYPVVAYPSTMQRLWYGQDVAPDIFPSDPAGELATMGVRYVTLNVGELQRGVADVLRRMLMQPGIRRVVADGRIEIYQVDSQAVRPVLLPGAGWQSAEHDGERVWRWMGGEAELRLLTRTPTQVSLTFEATAYQSAQQLFVRLDGVAMEAMTIPAAPASRRVTFAVMVPAGAHLFQLASATFVTPEGRRISVSVSHLVFRAQPLAVPVVPALPTLPWRAQPPCD